MGSPKFSPLGSAWATALGLKEGNPTSPQRVLCQLGRLPNVVWATGHWEQLSARPARSPRSSGQTGRELRRGARARGGNLGQEMSSWRKGAGIHAQPGASSGGWRGVRDAETHSQQSEGAAPVAQIWCDVKPGTGRGRRPRSVTPTLRRVSLKPPPVSRGLPLPLLQPA